MDRAIVLATQEGLPLVYSSDDPEKVAEAQARHGREQLAQAFDGFFAELARQNVLAAVAGAHKATAIHAVLQSGLVDRLIIDAPAANALERLAAEQPT